ncbi:MAG TPA: ParB/RepB/Spo0J family partition protein [Planctomycetota bacterium]|nr:ParB/RepB/Spo0J family partition protein [Planctomycetota bacterium]
MEATKIVMDGTTPPAGVDPRPAPDSDAGLETWTVPLAQIDAEGSAFRFRRTIRPDARIRELAASIEAQGLLHPLVVRKKGDLFELVSGFRRHGAMTFLARTKGIAPSAYPVKVSVLPDGTSDDEALRVAFAENLARKTFDATEKAIAVVRLRDEFGKTQEEIADLLKVSKAGLQQVLELLAAPEDVRVAFRGGRLALKHALAIARIQDPAARETVIRRAGVKGLRASAIAAAAGGGGRIEVVASPEEPAEENPLPEKARSIAKLSRAADPVYPFRLTLRLKSEEAVLRVARYALRVA